MGLLDCIVIVGLLVICLGVSSMVGVVLIVCFGSVAFCGFLGYVACFGLLVV